MVLKSIRNLSSGATQTLAPNSIMFSLIQPTGRVHIGNYLGALSNWRDVSNDEANKNSTFIFGTADLHALTSIWDKTLLKKSRMEALASLITAGIDPEKCILYHQSSVPQHTELQWVLTCLTSMGALNRMTQWKSKAKVDNSSSIFDEDTLGKTKAGVFSYPVLQAADILIYRATHVPVGDDQSQHLELSRNIASTFNHTFKTDFFPLPQSVFTPSKKIMSLRNVTKKMSKSDPDQNGCLYIMESPESISKKLRKATTDSIQGKIYFDPIERPGVSNLINIIAGLTRKSIDDTVNELTWIKDHKQLKDHVTELIVEEFKEKRHLFEQLMTDETYLEEISRKGTIKAKQIAEPNMKRIKELIGLD